jgi:hypothetical protein
MSHFVIVPEALRQAINDALDAALAACPDAARDRDHLYAQLLAFYDEHGYLPSFALAKSESPPTAPEPSAPDDRWWERTPGA